MGKSILEYFPKNKIPRSGQDYALEQIEAAIPWADVIVVRAPTATGKTDCGVTTARWAHSERKLKSHIIVPTKQLVDQLLQEHPRMVALKARADYPCEDETTLVGPRGGVTTETCGLCDPCQARIKANKMIRVVPYGVSNYHVYYSYKLYKPLLIVDEAHKLLDLLKEMGAIKFSQRDYSFPDDLETYGDVLGWAEREMRGRPRPKLEKLITQLKSLQPSTTLHITREYYRGREDTVMKLLPLDVKHLPPWFWPSKVRKIVLMSATIGPQDVDDLGLGDRKVAYVDCGSPIPASARPVFFTPVADMRLSRHQDSIPRLATHIANLAQKMQGSKGLIHATYRVAEGLRLSSLSQNKRFIFHVASNRKQKFDEFMASRDGILVASGMQEGIDLPYDACRWQVVTQVPWPSLEDQATKDRLGTDPTWYLWQTVKTILQACGRVCRTPDDYGCTHVLDEQWERMYRAALKAKLIPQWFQDAVV
jgi:Rad3-related DNA helicase